MYMQEMQASSSSTNEVLKTNASARENVEDRQVADSILRFVDFRLKPFWLGSAGKKNSTRFGSCLVVVYRLIDCCCCQQC
jgi:hypothetical protein